MSEDDDLDRTDSNGVADALATAVVTSNYKVLGQMDDGAGVSVLGQNDASDGTPVGVKGVTPNTGGGYGLATPDGARIVGAVDTSGSPFTVRTGTINSGSASNVVLGHGRNDASGAVGSTISGGGYVDFSTQEETRPKGTTGRSRGDGATERRGRCRLSAAGRKTGWTSSDGAERSPVASGTSPATSTARSAAARRTRPAGRTRRRPGGHRTERRPDRGTGTRDGHAPRGERPPARATRGGRSDGRGDADPGEDRPVSGE